MNITLDEKITACGIAVAGAALVYKWARGRNKFVIEASADMNPWGHILSVSVRNGGLQPATLEKIEVVFLGKGAGQSHNLADCFPKTIYLPAFLPSGATWKRIALFPFEDESYLPAIRTAQSWVARRDIGRAYCRFHFSHRASPIKKRITNLRDDSESPRA